MQTLRQDIAYAFRQMRQSSVFTLTAMLTLALGTSEPPPPSFLLSTP